MEEIIAYKPSCGCKKRTYRTVRACLAHEEWCCYNPKNHACPTCKHYDYGYCKLHILEEKYDFVLTDSLAKHCPKWDSND